MGASVDAPVAGERRTAPERMAVRLLARVMPSAVRKKCHISTGQNGSYLDLLKDRDRDLDLLDERE